MYDSFLIRKDSLRNYTEDGKVAGFCFGVRFANYRGVFLSLHNGYYVEVDGKSYPVELQRFGVNGKPPRSFEELKNHALYEHWDMQDEATLYITKEGGLTPGMHRIGLLESILCNYGRTPRDEELVKNPPVPAPNGGRPLASGSKTTDVNYFDLELQE